MNAGNGEAPACHLSVARLIAFHSANRGLGGERTFPPLLELSKRLGQSPRFALTNPPDRGLSQTAATPAPPDTPKNFAPVRLAPVSAAPRAALPSEGKSGGAPSQSKTWRNDPWRSTVRQCSGALGEGRTAKDTQSARRLGIIVRGVYM